MSSLRDRRVFVAGGTGDVGEGVVRALIAHGATVIVPVRNQDKGNRLRAALADHAALKLIDGELGNITAAKALAKRVGEGGPLDGVIALLGGWWQGSPLSEVDEAVWNQVIADNLSSHYAVARAFIPLLRPREGTYIQLLGAAAEYPVPGSSLVSITAAAVAMLGRCLAAEGTGGAVRFRQIMIAALVATRSRAADASTEVTAEEIGTLAAKLIARNDDESPFVSRLPATRSADRV